MSDTTPRLQLPLIGDHSQKRIVMNAGLMRLESLVQAQAISRTTSAQPASPNDGDSYILPATPTGTVWVTLSSGTFVRAEGGAWEAVVFPEGAIVYIKNEGVFLLRTASGWTSFEDAIKLLNNLNRLGVGTTADAYNILAMKGPAALLSGKTTAEGGSGDISLTLNKEADGNSAQILLQKSYSTRAVLGLLGDSNLSLKVSPDGSNWRTAFTVNRFSGHVRFGKTTYKTPAIPQRNYVTGAVWLISSSGADNNWQSICWSAELGLFCVVGASGSGNRVMTSPDGIIWTARTSAVDNQWLSVCWSAELSLFCAVSNTGTGNRVMTSPDGVTWTARSSASDQAWYSVCWSAELGLFCAISSGAYVQTSPDGVSWTLRNAAANLQWRSVCWSADLGLFCAVAGSGTGNRVMTSPDGIAWTSRTSATDNTWNAVCWSAELGLYCAIASTGTGNRVMTSPNGVTWSLRISAADNSWTTVGWAAELGLFAAAGNSGTGTRAMTSVSMFKYPYRS